MFLKSLGSESTTQKVKREENLCLNFWLIETGRREIPVVGKERRSFFLLFSPGCVPK